MVVKRIGPRDERESIPQPATREPIFDRLSVERLPVARDDDAVFDEEVRPAVAQSCK